eukprot:7661083-Alexandrium_andersonii.AAC.1
MEKELTHWRPKGWQGDNHPGSKVGVALTRWMQCELAKDLGLPMEGWENNATINACAARIAATDDSHPLHLLVDRH